MQKIRDLMQQAATIPVKQNTDEKAMQTGYKDTQKPFVDIDKTCKNFAALIDAYNEGKSLGDKLKEKHMQLIHRLLVLLSNSKTIAQQQIGREFYYTINTDAKAIASLHKYAGTAPEKSIKAHIERCSNLIEFKVIQVGTKDNNYRYIIGLSKNCFAWKTTT
jgi:hypothetical protein